MSTPTTPTRVTLIKAKDCVHSVCFKAPDAKAPIQSIYVNRPLSNDWKKLTIIMEGE